MEMKMLNPLRVIAGNGVKRKTVGLVVKLTLNAGGDGDHDQFT